MAGDANDEFDTARLDERRGPQVPCLVLCLVAVRDYRNIELGKLPHIQVMERLFPLVSLGRGALSDRGELLKREHLPGGCVG